MPQHDTKERIGDPFAGLSAPEVLTGAQLVQRSLKDVSRQMRRPASIWRGGLADHAERLKSSFGGWVLLAFIVSVALPVLGAGAYLAFFAADQYASETRFAVRGMEKGPLEAMPSIGSLTGGGQLQDTAIVADYIRGRGMVEDLQKTLDLRDIYGRGDWLFSFSPDNPIERLVRYWRWQVDVATDPMSGIITVLVRAFTPEDALKVSHAVIAASEKLVNEMTDRARRDALKQAEQELRLAEKSLQDKIGAMRQLRDSEGILDVEKTSDAMMKLVGTLRTELVRMESEYATGRQSVAETAPQMRVLAARIRSAREQIGLLEARMTSSKAASAAAGLSAEPALAESYGRFDRLKLEQGLAQKHYAAAAAAYERARLELGSQQVYLTTFLQPVLAQEALYPKKGWIMAALTALCLALWGAGTGIAVLVRNYAA